MSQLPDFMLKRTLSFSVPLNNMGITDLENLKYESSNVKIFTITLRQYLGLVTIFMKINDRCNLLIDAWESEIITAEKVLTALEIMDYYTSDHSLNNSESGFDVFYSSLELAKELNMPVYLDF